MTAQPVPAFKAPEQPHVESIQEREKGQRDLVDGLRASNKALADEVHELRAKLASDSELIVLRKRAELRSGDWRQLRGGRHGIAARTDRRR
jgi:hypothetical protein